MRTETALSLFGKWPPFDPVFPYFSWGLITSKASTEFIVSLYHVEYLTSFRMARVCSIKDLTTGQTALWTREEGTEAGSALVPALLLAPGQPTQIWKEKCCFVEDALVSLGPKASHLQTQSCAFPLKSSLPVEMQMPACPKVYDCLNFKVEGVFRISSDSL